MTRIRRCLAWIAPVVACHIAVAVTALMTSLPARAQANSDAIFAVTNFDVAPGATTQTVALLKQYRDAVRKEQGNQGVDLFQETGFPNRFVIHETWSNRSAFDANEKAPALEALRNGLKPVAGGPYDRRTYRPLSIGAARNASTGNTAPGAAVYMLIHLDVFPPGLAPTLDLVKQVAADARKGDGNLRYDIEQSTSGPGNHMTLFGAWQNREDFDAYEMSRYARHLREAVGPLLGSPYDDRLYTRLD